MKDTEIDLLMYQDEFSAARMMVRVLQLTQINHSEDTILRQELVINELKETIINLKKSTM